MVTRRIRSEYMKKFKDPKWETYAKCYEEMLKYRLTRRLLEHTHNPWFWDGSDTDSESGGSPPSTKQAPAEASRDGPEREAEECGEGRVERATETVPRLPLHEGEEEEEEDVSAQRPAKDGSQLEGVGETAVPHKEPHQEKDTDGPRKVKASKSKQTCRSQQVRPAQAPQPTRDSKDSRHPFALYGSGEKDANIAGRKTYNVGPAASTNEIHVSALRAKTRREVERRFQTQRAERRRAKSAELAKARNVVQPEFNPWITEYMRCFSARSR